MSLRESLLNFFSEHGLSRTYWIGYSGGMDSHVLLALCASAQKALSLNIKVIHVHHGLSEHADAWSQHCRDICKTLGLEYHEQKIQLNIDAGESLEEQARIKRYQALAGYLASGDYLLTAHHQDDQAETVLIQLLRGAGPKGLAAMPSIKPFVNGFHARPLLAFPRSELHEFARANNLQWIEDESNQNTQLSRNYIRHDIMPLLKKQWPGALSAITRSADHCAETQSIVDEYAQALLATVTGSKPQLLSVSKLLTLDNSKKRLVLRGWISKSGYSIPNTKKLNTILDSVLVAGRDRVPCVKWKGVELRRYRDDLYLLRPSPNANQSGSVTKIPGATVKFRSSIDKSHRLKNLYQKYGVPPWERASVPIMMIGDEVVSIVGYYVNEKFL